MFGRTLCTHPTSGPVDIASHALGSDPFEHRAYRNLKLERGCLLKLIFS